MENRQVEALVEEAEVEEMEVDIPTTEIPVSQDNNNNDMKVINMTTPQINLHLIWVITRHNLQRSCKLLTWLVVCIMQPKLPLIMEVGIVIPIIANMVRPVEKLFSKFENWRKFLFVGPQIEYYYDVDHSTNIVWEVWAKRSLMIRCRISLSFQKISNF